jgi:hypothetical protein
VLVGSGSKYLFEESHVRIVRHRDIKGEAVRRGRKEGLTADAAALVTQLSLFLLQCSVVAKIRKVLLSVVARVVVRVSKVD